MDLIRTKAANVGLVLPQNGGNVAGGAIAEANPDDLRRESKQKAALVKLGVLRNNCEALFPGKFPDDLIGCALQAEVTDVRRIRENRGQDRDQPVGEILVKEELRHASRGNRQQLALAISRKSETSPDIFGSEIREILENFILSHAGSQVFEDLIDRNAQTANAGFAAALTGLNGDQLCVVHNLRVGAAEGKVKASAQAPRGRSEAQARHLSVVTHGRLSLVARRSVPVDSCGRQRH